MNCDQLCLINIGLKHVDNVIEEEFMSRQLVEPGLPSIAKQNQQVRNTLEEVCSAVGRDLKGLLHGKLAHELKDPVVEFVDK